MNTTTTAEATDHHQEASTAAPKVHRQRSATPANRRASLVLIEGIEDKVRPGPWRSRILSTLFAGTILWFLIQTVILHMVEVVYTPATAEHVAGVPVDGESARYPFASVVDEINLIFSQGLSAETFASPLVWMAILGLLWLLTNLMDRKPSGFSAKVLQDRPETFREAQHSFFTQPPHTGDLSVTGKEDVDGDQFGDDIPGHIRRALGWWHAPEPPETSLLLHSLGELKTHLQEDAYFWLRACAVWPEPHWHLVLYLGRGLRNERGESLHSFETADRLASLPWFMAGSMPLWLRRHFLGTMSKEQQQQVRHLAQSLLISTARGTKGDFALELAEHHALFMQFGGAETAQAILQELPAESPLREELFTQFVARPLEPQFYKGFSRGEGNAAAAGADFARISRSTAWLSRALWTACAVALGAIVILLPLLSVFGGVRVSTRHNQGIVQVGESKKEPPATFYWMPLGQREVIVMSKDFETVLLRVNVKSRTITDVGPIVMSHNRAGATAPQPGEVDTPAPAAP